MSTKELKTKRTKLVWKSIYYKKEANCWDEFPLVILAKAVRGQDWFKGDILLAGKSNAQAKQKFITEPERWNEPKHLLLLQMYKDTKIRIKIDWIFEETRCSILLDSPTSDEYYPNSGNLAPKPTKSRYIEGALDRIVEAFNIARPIIDQKIADKLEEEEEIETAKEYHKKMCDELGIEVRKEFRKYEPLYDYAYKQGRHFGITFEKCEEGDTFNISGIAGNFTITEIKQLIKYIGGCPSAIASRLTGKKGKG